MALRRFKLVGILIALGMLAGPVFVVAPTGAAGGGVTSYNVGLTSVPEDMAPGQSFHGGTIVTVNRDISFISVDTSDPVGFLSATATDPNVRYSEEDPEQAMISPIFSDDSFSHTPIGFVPNDPLFVTQYGLTQVRAPQAWTTTLGTRSAAVCIVDTGVRYTHEDLVGERWRGGYDFVNNDADPWDDNGHGTHVAGIAAATTNNLKGVAGVGQVDIYGVKVLSSGGGGSWAGVANGIVWCANNAPRTTVISMSLGGSGFSQAVQDAARYAVAQGQLLVAAAGNGACNNCVGYPAKLAEVVAVTCTSVGETLCWFSSTGPEAEIAAPGDSTMSAYNTANNAYVALSGTSMSTPHVSGAAALVWSVNTGLTNAQLRTRLQATAQDLGPPGRDVDFGYGELDVKCLLDNTSPCSGVI